MIVPKIYVIATEDGFLGRKLSKNGSLKEVSADIDDRHCMDRIWFSIDKVNAEDKQAECERCHLYNRYAMGTGLLEVDNKDGMFDEAIMKYCSDELEMLKKLEEM